MAYVNTLLTVLATALLAVWPLEPTPEVVQRFDPPEQNWHAGHRGVDLEGSPGQVVGAALAGQIGFVGTIGGKPVVTVIHGEQRTTYEPVVGTVAAGEEVTAGTPLGRLQTAGSHCFPATCLHWGLREGDTYLDPLSLVGDGPVRLLPLWRDDPVVPRTLAPPLSDWSRPLDACAQARGWACW